MNPPALRLMIPFAVLVCSLLSWTLNSPTRITDSPMQPIAAKQYQVLQHTSDRLLVQSPNGLIVLAQSLPTSPVVCAKVLVKTGSIYEQQHVGAGLSHFLEHLVSGGTTSTRTEAQSNALLAKIGGITNASTGLNRVDYYINTTSDHAEQAIDLLSDWLNNTQITQREYERERDVIQREFENGYGQPSRIFWRILQQAVFNVHPAQHPGIGYIDEFLTITRDELIAFYKQMYVPNNMVFVICGDIDKQKVVDQIIQRWSDVPAKPLPKLAFPVEPDWQGIREVSAIAQINIDRPRVRLVWQGTQMGHEDDYAMDVLAIILGQGDTSRLIKTVRDQDQLVTQISSSNISWSWIKGFFMVEAEVATSIDQVKKRIFQVIDQLIQKGITEQELALAKRQVLAGVAYTGQNAEHLASRLGSDLIEMGDPDYLPYYAQGIQALTISDIHLAAKKYLSNKNIVIAKLLPMQEGQKTEVVRSPPAITAKQQAQIDQLQHHAVQLDNAYIVKRLLASNAPTQQKDNAIEVLPIERMMLDNGLVVLIGKSTLSPSVTLKFFRPGGLVSDPLDQPGLSKAAANMRKKGTTTATADQIATQIDAMGASLSTDSGSYTESTSAQCLKDDLPSVMALFADVILNPAFEKQEWDKLRPRLVAAYDRQKTNWYREIRLLMQQHYYQGSTLAHSQYGNKETLASFTAEQLKQFYNHRLTGNDAVLAVFGDVDVDEVKALVKKHFQALPSKAQKPFDWPTIKTAGPSWQQHTRGRRMGAVQLAFGPGTTLDQADYATVQVLMRVLSSFPTGWLDQALRGQHGGLVYVTWAWQASGPVPGYIGLLFNAEPANLPKALQLSIDVVHRAKTQLVDDQTLANAKASLLTRELFAKQSNGQRATQTALDEIYNLGPDHQQVFMQQVHDVDALALREAARKYLTDPVMIVVNVDPFEDSVLQQAFEALQK